MEFDTEPLTFAIDNLIEECKINYLEIGPWDGIGDGHNYSGERFQKYVEITAELLRQGAYSYKYRNPRYLKHFLIRFFYKLYDNFTMDINNNENDIYEITAMCIKIGLNINEKNKKTSILGFACELGYVTVVELLLKNGVKIDSNTIYQLNEGISELEDIVDEYSAFRKTFQTSLLMRKLINHEQKRRLLAVNKKINPDMIKTIYGFIN